MHLWIKSVSVRKLLKMQTIVSQVYKNMIIKDITAQTSIMKKMNLNNIIIHFG